jgi:signal transduction histidine kinase
MNEHAQILNSDGEVEQVRARIEQAERPIPQPEFQAALYDALLYGLGRTLSLYGAPSVGVLIREMGRRIREYLEELGYHLGSATTMSAAIEEITRFFTSHHFAELEMLHDGGSMFHARWHRLVGLRAYERIVAAGGETFISCPMNAVLNDLLASFGKQLEVRWKHFNLVEGWVESVEEVVDLDPEPSVSRELVLDPERLLRLEQEQSRQLRLRDEFIRIASHELATPVTAMKLALKRVENIPVADEKVAHALVVIRRQQRRLEQLVTEMHDTTRIQIGRLQLVRAPVDLVRLTSDAIELLTPSKDPQAKQIHLGGLASLEGRWDAARLEQVVTNLLTNALKYGNGQPIHVEITQFGDCARLTVRDEGIGIAADALDRIFRPFERAVSVETHSGLGLGLYIARSVVEMHGGTIRVDSELGLGSTFTVELPLDSPIEPGILVERPQRECPPSS